MDRIDRKRQKTNDKRQNYSKLLPFYFLIFIFTCFFSACFDSNQNTNTESNDLPAFEIPAPQINLAEPLKISREPKDVALCDKINRTIGQSEFSNARWGIIAVSLKDGRIVCGRDGRKLFTPASVQKILMSVVALEKLGADFRWKTSVYAEKEITDGMLDDDLILYGQGAPDFDSQGAENLAGQLQAKGLKRVKGNIIGDESYFKGDTIGDGWTWNELQWYYGAAASALSINRNFVNVSLQNGKLQTSPATDFVETSANVQPAQSGEIEAVGLKRELGTNQIYAWGQGKNLDARVAVENPALWSAKILKDALRKKGITVEGEAKSADWKTQNKPDVSNLTEIAAVESATLGEIVGKMNKDSVNLYAELILRTLGKKYGGDAPDENPKLQKLRGDDSAGASVMKKWLAENNVLTDEIKIHDASGLSRLNFVTPEAVSRALIFASQAKFSDVFRNSLPVSGQSGTLRGRLTGASGKIAAKTGSIMYVNSLAGYANSQDETFAFVIFCNNQTRASDSSVIIDSIAASLVNN